VGKWVIQDVKFKGTYEDILKTNEKDFHTFFGATGWTNAINKTYEFKADSLLETDMLSNKIKEKVKMSYILNENIDIEVNIISENTKLEYTIIFEKLDYDLMIWHFGNYMDITLKRINEN
jgi:hypothetical protein